eukprot:85285-Prorocentrum_minimum.AAC.1
MDTVRREKLSKLERATPSLVRFDTPKSKPFHYHSKPMSGVTAVYFSLQEEVKGSSSNTICNTNESSTTLA